MSFWVRGWQAEEWQTARTAGLIQLGTLSGQDSHFRTYVSWFLESTTLNAATTPIVAGVVAVQQPELDPPDQPPDPGAANFPIEGDWWELETHYPVLAGSRSTQRVYWPGDRSRLWDIKTNRRVPTGQLLRYYFRWAAPADEASSIRAVVAWSTLVEVRG